MTTPTIRDSGPPLARDSGLPLARDSGLLLALGAYVWWGLLPAYFHALAGVSPFALVCWRVVLTVPLCLVLIAWRREGAALRAALGNRQVLGLLLVTATLIGANWLIYVTAIAQGHVFAASIGYYLNPLINVALGTLFLGERLRPRQWGAVGLAAIGVAVLAWGATDTLAISCAMALTFSLYSMARKLAPVAPLPGLTVETLVLLVPSLLLLHALGRAGVAPAFGISARQDGLVAMAGLITALPLLMFAGAARRLDLSVLGFVQYVSPSIAFVLGLTLFHEVLRPVQLACFALMWAAMGLFCWDLLARRRD